VTHAGKSIFYFGFWVVICGISLLFFPAFCLGVAGIVLSDYIIVRIFGLVLLYLSVYYFVAGRYPAFHPFYRATVFTRSSALAVVIIFVLLGMAQPIVIGFVIVDALGALWTGLALRKDRMESAIPD
jgi:hypothetical protein